MKKRSDWEIYLEILDTLKKMKLREEEIYKTNIMHEVNMNWKSFDKHFKYLEQKKFVQKNNKDYKITQEGKKLHNTLNKLNNLLT
ncbi:winged helix-turn-helix domain-containing protein [Methanonatronarchaeum sp. AMET-Sl]|uniref:winged helix-turn-helix domain-containing protein n=1 Tax=Methanonatronarchaeum sp. AMET-Sl TaxID=3037654 RepID=UPI00244DA745|nr:winged helix-turn-helix domain-containing protein [Methanonatronarchaeum sp. AMET-Sl]WGI17121.1 winged helix-turn-helix domain-containing protein [Methanonatronarchaeum sp. AMET-Sl]